MAHQACNPLMGSLMGIVKAKEFPLYFLLNIPLTIESRISTAVICLHREKTFFECQRYQIDLPSQRFARLPHPATLSRIYLGNKTFN